MSGRLRPQTTHLLRASDEARLDELEANPRGLHHEQRDTATGQWAAALALVQHASVQQAAQSSVVHGKVNILLNASSCTQSYYVNFVMDFTE